jgi:general secretion pathway protein G
MFQSNAQTANHNVIRRARRAAFSLIELLLVLVILAILMGVVVTKFTGRTKQAQETAAKTDIGAIGLALDAFEVDNGRCPSTEEGLGALIQQPSSTQNWRGPYLKRDGIPSDPWGQPYVYRYPGQNNPTGYDLASLGPDGREGTDDITNWTASR